MAKSRIPDPIQRRHLLERDLAEAQALKYAECYLDEGRQVEAIEFLRKADAEDKLLEICRGALESGDAFLVRAVSVALGREPSSEEWRSVARAAEAAGKERYAHEARRQAEVGEG